MAAKHDIRRRIRAHIEAEADQLVEVCERAAEPISDHKRLDAEVQVESGRVTVSLMVTPLLRASAPAKQSWVTVIGFEVEPEGVMYVETALARYKTVQPQVLGFIPSGPKTLAGRREYLMLLDALENELRALDSKGSIIRT
jgi:hypothetical protein